MEEFICEICFKTFKLKDNAIHHLKEAHQIRRNPENYMFRGEIIDKTDYSDSDNND